MQMFWSTDDKKKSSLSEFCLIWLVWKEIYSSFQHKHAQVHKPTATKERDISWGFRFWLGAVANVRAVFWSVGCLIIEDSGSGPVTPACLECFLCN